MEAELDKVIGCDFKRIPDVLKRLNAHKESLVNKLTGTTGVVMESSEVAWYNALHKAKEALEELNRLKQQCVTISLPSSSNTSSNRPMVLMTKYQSLVTEVKQLQNILSYISWLVRVQETSSNMEVAIATSPVSRQAVDLYLGLVTMTTKLQDTRCSNLKRYVNETTSYWKQKLNDKISSEFSSLMKLLRWPLTTSSSDHVSSVWESIQEKMTELVMIMIEIEQQANPGRMTSTGTVPALHDPVMLLVLLLAQPLKKRFLYHFTGNKKTNSAEKPEWYLSQVLAWIRDHSSFLEEKIQPLLEVTGVAVDVRAEFIRCLLQEVDQKLRHDLPSLSDNEVATAHTIDELLSFERELRSSLCYHQPLPSCVGVLMEQEHFNKWITLERKYTIERLSAIMESPTAWDLQYKEVVDIDISKVTICAEQLMSLMASITDRYKLLYSPPHQLDFNSLQLDLLIAFHHDLTDAASNRESQILPLSRQQAAYLNTALYIAMVMTEWGEQTFFLELHHYKEQLKEFISSGTYHSYSELSLEDVDSSTSQLTGTVFDDVVKMFTESAHSIEHCMASHILNTWRAKCAHYRNHKWQNLPSAGDYVTMELSSVACDLLVSLRQQLQFLEANVCQAACKKIWPIILDGLDSLIISEVILMCHFNEGGGAQLQYDITRNLIPLLAQHTGLKSSQIMMRSQEACKLLTVLPGSAKLVKELLVAVEQQQSRSDDNSYDIAVTSLADMKIYNLTPNDAHQVLSKRLLPE